MTHRRMKYLALAAAGGVLLQAASCGYMLVDLLVQNVLPLVLSQLIAGAVDTGATP